MSDGLDLFHVQKETENYVHLILSNTFSETHLKKDVFIQTLDDLKKIDKHLLIDLRENVYVGRELIGFLITLKFQQKDEGLKLALTGLKNRVHSLMEWLHLESLLYELRSVDDADTYFQNDAM